MKGFIEDFLYFCNINIPINMKQRLILMMLALLMITTANAKVRMPQLFQDGMVLQRNVAIPVWGWADKGEQIIVSLADGKGKVLSTATTVADEEGHWRVSLPNSKKMKAGGPYELKVGNEEAGVSIKDVLLGDV